MEHHLAMLIVIGTSHMSIVIGTSRMLIVIRTSHNIMLTLYMVRFINIFFYRSKMLESSSSDEAPDGDEVEDGPPRGGVRGLKHHKDEPMGGLAVPQAGAAR